MVQYFTLQDQTTKGYGMGVAEMKKNTKGQGPS
jgi:hypothetical protein